MKTLIFSGWAQSPDGLAMLAEEPVLCDWANNKNHLQLRDEPVDIIAWSYGGRRALSLILGASYQVRHLTLIGVPVQFVGADGMGPETFATFRKNYEEDPARTSQRFAGLIAKGDAHEREVRLAAQRHLQDVLDTPLWLKRLDQYAHGAMDQRPFPFTHIPTLILHGANDAIVPYAQAERMQRWMPHAQLERWENTGHAPHWHDAARLRAQIEAHRAQFDFAAIAAQRTSDFRQECANAGLILK